MEGWSCRCDVPVKQLRSSRSGFSKALYSESNMTIRDANVESKSKGSKLGTVIVH